MADNVVGIKFGVLGGSSISGESGHLIKTQLEELSKEVHLKVNIDKNHFAQQLQSLKAELEKTLGDLKITIKTDNVTATQGNGGTSSGGAGGSSAQSKTSVYANLQRQLESLATAEARLAKIGNEAAVSTEIQKRKVEELKNAYIDSRLEAMSNNKITAEQAKSLNDYSDALRDAILAEQKRASSADAVSKLDMSYAKLKRNAQSLYTDSGFDKVIARSAKAQKLVDDFNAKVESAFADKNMSTEDKQAAVKKLNQEFVSTQGELKKIQKETDTLGNKLKDTFTSKILQTFAYALIGVATNALKQVYQNVVELDKAVTDLQIATGYTREETQNLIKSYSDMGRQLGATTTEVAAAADTWLRQGYSIEEANTLIRNTMMLSKLGQIESAEAAKALTSAMKGYNVEVGNSIDVVDKFTAVDMVAATSAGDIATAMAETAVSANTAGVSMDKLIGYIATVSEVTQDGAESVGTFYKTMFARMSNIKAGKFVDDETGESLNDVSAVLDQVGIKLFDTAGEFRDFEDVLDELGTKWEHLNEVERAAIATAMAGTRQQEKFKVLMENYASAMDLSGVASDSSGTAAAKYEEAYMDSIEAKLNSLTAAWQDFSQGLLDSEVVKVLVDAIIGIVDVLDFVINGFDGAIGKTALLTAAIVLLEVVLKKCAGRFKSFGTSMKKAFTSINTYITIFLLLVNVLDSIQDKNIAGWAMLGLGVAAAITMIVLAVKGGIKSIDGTLKGFMASNPFGWILAAITAVATAIMGIFKLSEASRNKGKADFEEAKKIAEEKKKLAEEEMQQAKEINDLAREYEELVGDKEDFLDLDEATRNRILEIQNEINSSVTTEATYLDLVNGKLNDKLEALKEIKRAEQEEALQAAKDSYLAQKSLQSEAFNDDGHFIPSKRIDNLDGIGYDLVDNPKVGEYGSIAFEAGGDAAKYANKIADIFDGKSQIYSFKNYQVGDIGWNIGFKDYADLELMAQEYKEAIDEAREKYYTKGDNATRRLIDSLYNYYTDEILPLIEGVDEAAMEVANAQLPLLIDEIDVDPSRDIEGFEEALINKMTSAMKEYGLSADAIESLVKSYLLTNYYDEYTKNVAGTVKYSFDTILEAVSKGYDALKAAMDDMGELGIVSADTIRDISKNYPELLEYLELTQDGYKIAESAIDSFLATLKETYGMGENESTWNAVLSTLMATEDIEKWISEQEKVKEAYEEELDAHQKLVDMRKELLKTYQKEIKYQDDLRKKQEDVARLRTQLAVAQLDTSAAGKARVQELRAELESAEEELDDFTLEHAIDVLTQQIDSGYEEEKIFIESQITRIETAINNAASMYKGESSTTSSTSIAGVGERSRTLETHHTGGFVGDIASLKDNEVFAKLLEGEFVSTPAQMSKFLKDTYPKMLGMAQGGNGGIQYNAPIVAIRCDSVTEDTMPTLKKVVKQAVDEVKKEIDSAFSRTGYRREVNKFSI